MLSRVHMWKIKLNKHTHTQIDLHRQYMWIMETFWAGTLQPKLCTQVWRNRHHHRLHHKQSGFTDSPYGYEVKAALLSCSCIIWHQSNFIVQKAVAHMDGQCGALAVVQWRKALMKGRLSSAKEYLKLGQNQSEHDCLLTRCTFVISWLGFRHTLVLCLGWAGSAG